MTLVGERSDAEHAARFVAQWHRSKAPAELAAASTDGGRLMRISHNLVLKGNVNVGHHLPFQQEFTMGGTSARKVPSSGTVTVKSWV